jgi:hypothetical protein
LGEGSVGAVGGGFWAPPPTVVVTLSAPGRSHLAVGVLGDQ